MTAQTAATELEPVIADDARTVAFYSKGTHLRLVRKHGRVKQNPLNGGFYDDPDHLSDVVEFAPRGRIELEPGERIEVDGKGWLADAQELERRGVEGGYRPRDLISALRAHKGWNIDFFEEGAEPDMPQPTPERFNEMLTAFRLDMDVENLRGLVETEKATHNRPTLVQSAQVTLDAIEKAFADAEAQQAAAEKGAKK